MRHGRSAHPPTGWMDASAVRAWLTAYDAAALAEGETPPAPVRTLAEEAGIVVASDLPRAVASAELLLPEGPLATSPLLREAPPPIPGFSGARLPVAVWGLTIGARLALDALRGARQPVELERRTRSAAAWLRGLATNHGTVLAVTHATFRRLLVNRLVSEGWRHAPGPRRMHHWSTWVLVRDEPSNGRHR